MPTESFFSKIARFIGDITETFHQTNRNLGELSDAIRKNTKAQTESNQTQVKNDGPDQQLTAVLDVVKRIETDQGKANTAQSRYQNRNLVAAWAGVIVVLAYTTFTALQWNTMEQTYTKITAQTKATEAANTINRTNTAVSQRAYMIFPPQSPHIEPMHDKETGGISWMLFVPIDNGGNTPAFKVLRRANDNFPDFRELPNGFDYADTKDTGRRMLPNLPNTSGPIIAGAHGTINGGVLAIPETVLERVNVGESHVYIWGWTLYTDVFGCGHKTEFCWRVAGFVHNADRSSAEIATSECAEHNCADKDCADYAPTKAPVCSMEANPLQNAEALE